MITKFLTKYRMIVGQLNKITHKKHLHHHKTMFTKHVISYQQTIKH